MVGTRVAPARRYSSCARVAGALRRADRLRIGLPVVVVVILVLCAAIGGVFSAYQRSEQSHHTQEERLSAHIDSLNRVVDSLAVKADTPSPREVVRRQAASIHLARQQAIRQAVQRGEIKTLNEARAYDGGLKENFAKTERGIQDPVLHEEFMQAYFSYFNLDDRLYDSLALVLPDD